MELRQLRYFCAACRCGTLSRAASELFVTEQTLSSAIKKLEIELGCPLLVRSKQGVEPTEVGQLFLERGLHILADLDDTLSIVRDKKTPREQVNLYISTLSVPETEGFSIETLDSFVQENPQMDVTVSESPTQGCIQALHQGEADIAFVYCWPQSPELEAHLVFEGRVIIAFSDDHPLAGKTELSFDDLKGETFLSAGDEARGKKMIVKRCQEHGFDPTWRTVPSLYYLQSAANGKGFALALDGHPLLNSIPGLCARHLVEKDDFTLPLALVVKKNCSTATRSLLAYLLEAWSGHAIAS